MLLECPACARSYHVDRSELDGGRLVACPRCRAEWFVADLAGTRAKADPAMSPVPPDLVGQGHVRVGVGLGVAILALMLVIGARERVVRAMPRTEALFAAVGMPVNVRGLAFDKVTLATSEGGTSDLAVTGEIRNVTAHRVGMPRLAFDVRDASGAPLLSWTETASAKALPAGGTLTFRSAPHMLPDQARSVTVHFETGGETRRFARL